MKQATRYPKSLRQFVDLLQPYQKNISLISLFGSYARGDWDKDSDIDVLVVSQSNDYKFRDKIFKLVDQAMASVGYNELLSPIIMDVNHFNKMKRNNSDFYYFLNKEGKVLWQKTT